MSRRVANGAWLPLIDYSIRRGVSLSTLRRYIKARKIEFKIENGKYLLFDDTAGESEAPSEISSGVRPSSGAETAQLRFAVTRLEQDLKTAREEIAELKTLIALYEETPPTRPTPAHSLDH